MAKQSIIKQKFQKSNYDCGQTVLDMLGYDGHALVPNRGVESSDLWAIEGISIVEIPLLQAWLDGQEIPKKIARFESFDYTRPYIWGFISKPLLESAEKWLEERDADWAQKHLEESTKRIEALTKEEMDAQETIALFEEVEKDMPPRPTIIDAVQSVDAGHWVIRHKDKIYCPKLGTVDAETYTKEAIGLVTQVFSVIFRESTGAVRRKIPKAGRNDPCPCGSKRKFKKCCGKRRRRNPDDKGRVRCPDCGGYRRNMDRRERELQRQRTLGVGDPVRLLAHRIRSGTLPVDYVRRAAALGDPTSIEYVRVQGLEPWVDFCMRKSRFCGGRSRDLFYRHALPGLRFMLAILEGLPRTLIVSFAADSAERTLYIYEDAYPGDTRPRDAIEAARKWAQGTRSGVWPVTLYMGRHSDASATRVALHRARTASFAADDAAYAAVMNDADYAAADAAHEAARAARAAYAAADDAANVGEAAADYAAAVYSRREEAWQKQRLIQYLLGEVQV